MLSCRHVDGCSTVETDRAACFAARLKNRENKALLVLPLFRSIQCKKHSHIIVGQVAAVLGVAQHSNVIAVDAQGALATCVMWLGRLEQEHGRRGVFERQHKCSRQKTTQLVRLVTQRRRAGCCAVRCTRGCGNKDWPTSPVSNKRLPRRSLTLSQPHSPSRSPSTADSPGSCRRTMVQHAARRPDTTSGSPTRRLSRGCSASPAAPAAPAARGDSDGSRSLLLTSPPSPPESTDLLPSVSELLLLGMASEATGLLAGGAPAPTPPAAASALCCCWKAPSGGGLLCSSSCAACCCCVRPQSG